MLCPELDFEGDLGVLQDAKLVAGYALQQSMDHCANVPVDALDAFERNPR